MSKILEMGDARVTMNLSVPPGAPEALKAFSKSKGRKQRDILARLIGWFARQPSIVKTVAQDDVDEGMEEAYAKALERMAHDLRNPPTPWTKGDVVNHVDDPAEQTRQRIAQQHNAQLAPAEEVAAYLKSLGSDAVADEPSPVTVPPAEGGSDKTRRRPPRERR